MALRVADIRPGAVAYLAGDALAFDAEVWHPVFAVPPEIPHPFICVATTEDISAWVGVTSNQHRNPLRTRLRIRPEWRVGGGAGWSSRPQFPHSGREVYCGPHGSFARASTPDCYGGGNRPRLTDAGLAAVIAEIERHAPMAKYIGVMESIVYPAGLSVADWLP